jgi:2,5-diketo-D-gluconate reductase A
MAYTPMADPQVIKIAAAHKVTPAQVLIQWQYALGIPVQPRTQNAEHMRDNLNSFSFTLTEDEIKTLSTAAQDMCSKDGSWYECAAKPRPW